jgi:dCMP deaminase
MRQMIQQYLMTMTQTVATRTTCPRRRVGAIIVDDRNIILGTGYNGVPREMDHCIDTPCPGARDEAGNTNNCYAVHAEQNAIINCHNISRAVAMYCTALPCFVCIKMIANTPIKEVYFMEQYPDDRTYVMATQADIRLTQVRLDA